MKYYNGEKIHPELDENRYNFPSQRKFDVNEIEPALRRNNYSYKCLSHYESERSKARKVKILWGIIIIGTILATICHFVVEPGILPTPKAEAASNQQELCDRYLADSSLNGTAGKMTLLSICN